MIGRVADGEPPDSSRTSRSGFDEELLTGSYPFLLASGTRQLYSFTRCGGSNQHVSKCTSIALPTEAKGAV